jgi:hypothetical protein
MEQKPTENRRFARDGLLVYILQIEALYLRENDRDSDFNGQKRLETGVKICCHLWHNR